ncbi:MAG TPA: tRNA epoxyqueuosine(34) reductase QueG [Fimbriiglobus sp.]|jgi:epoxyqueuosine reductase
MTATGDRRIESRWKAEATRLGFSLSGIAPATDADGFDRFRDWLARGYHGEMGYLQKFESERRNPRGILESVKSVLMVGFEYGPSSTPHSSHQTPHLGRVAAYARGPDYHHTMWDRLNELAVWLEGEIACESRAVADTAPLLERDFARRAGLGWVGNNTMLIHPARGSYFFLGAVLTSLTLEPDPPFEARHCGTCTACLDACPTAAFPEPGVLDATKCISYLTIEHRSAIPLAAREAVGDWVFGCDVCQDVCPWNRFAGPGGSPPDPTLSTLDCVALLGLDEPSFRAKFRNTVFFRAKRAGMLRNAAVVLGNTGDETCLPALDRAAGDPNELVREAAVWAAERVRQRRDLRACDGSNR